MAFLQHGKWFADWWNADGKRQRKSFTRQVDALRYEHQMLAEAHAIRLGRELRNVLHHTRRKPARLREHLKRAAQLAESEALKPAPQRPGPAWTKQSA